MSLLDSTAVRVVDSLREAYAQALKDLRKATEAVRDSLSAGSASVDESLARASRRYQTARGRYRTAFEGIKRFKSFGGNPIFSDADLKVSTATLLEDTADRFYRGKAFSLETEGEIRQFIRNRLVKLEREVNRARSAVARLRKSSAGNTTALKAVEADYEKRRVSLRERFNREILTELQARVSYRTAVDSTRRYLFGRLPAGRYHLYAPDPLPQAWLLPLELRGHTRQDLGVKNQRMLMIVEEGISARD